MKLFKLFALSLVALPSVALGMESAQPVPNMTANLKPIPKNLEKKCYKSQTGEPNLNFLLFQWFSPDSSDIQQQIWYRRPTVWATAAAIAGLGASYVYRDSLAELIRNPSVLPKNALSLWAGIKSVFAR